MAKDTDKREKGGGEVRRDREFNACIKVAIPCSHFNIIVGHAVGLFYVFLPELVPKNE